MSDDKDSQPHRDEQPSPQPQPQPDRRDDGDFLEHRQKQGVFIPPVNRDVPEPPPSSDDE